MGCWVAEQEQNRSEEATPFKREEARKRGSVAKSMEINSLFVLTGAFALASLGGERAIREVLVVVQSILEQAALLSFDLASVHTWFNGAIIIALKILAPLLGGLAIVGIIANLVQTGPIFSFQPIKPDFDRINPMSGFKRLFSLKLLFEAGKSIIKLFLFAAVLTMAFVHIIPSLLQLMSLPPMGETAKGLELGLGVMAKLLLVLLLITLFDLMFVRWDYSKQLRMSPREMKEEIKRREGDPRIRARMRELQREMVKRSQSLSRVKDADVLITNPAHLAVALVYKRGQMDAPRVIAKGAGEVAQRMKIMARRYRVPVVENKGLARRLFRHVQMEQSVPTDLFSQVARILIWVYAMRDARRETRVYA